VDLEEVVEAQDERLLRGLIAKHVEATGSPRGKWILENWAQMLPKFVKVFPHEYKRVLGIARKKKEASHTVMAGQVAGQHQVVHHG
jgi:glutamate synthase (NADPH/NADH) large chain